jgi:fumarylacetoacetate (FAA) hydrolase
MRFCNFHPPGREQEGELPLPGVLLHDRIYPLHLLLEDFVETHERGGIPVPIGFRFGEVNTVAHIPSWRERLDGIEESDLADLSNWNSEEVRFAPPVYHPASFRDFYAFEEHVRTARAGRGLEMVPEWYELPVFYFSNHDAFITHGDELPLPRSGKWLDFELEVAAVIVAEGRDVTPEEGERLIGGYCVLNDWSLRDVQRREMKVGLGPAKGKDFASGLGPWLVTPDELADRRSDKGFDLNMTAEINGRQVSSGNWKSIHYSFGEMIARAAADVTLRPGDIIGSGTVGTGCILELGPERAGGWLEPGDVVALQIERLGRLENRISMG